MFKIKLFQLGNKCTFPIEKSICNIYCVLVCRACLIQIIVMQTYLVAEIYGRNIEYVQEIKSTYFTALDLHSPICRLKIASWLSLTEGQHKTPLH